jgi:hypothetical protein
MWGNLVTVVNRTSKPLEFIFDGRAYILKPGDNPGIYESLAGHAKGKFPAMGSEDPYEPTSFICLIGVKEWGDDISPLEQTDAIERMDRSKLPAPTMRDGKPGKVVAGPRNSWRPIAESAPAKNLTQFSGGSGVGKDGD